MTKPPAHLTKSRSQASEGTLEKIRTRVEEVRDILFQISDHEAAIKDLKASYLKLTRITLPEMFNEARVPAITIEAHGNLPRIEATREPYYRANIAADWDEDRRKAAFAYLEKKKAGDLIKATITALLGRDSRPKQKQIIKFLEGKKVDYSSKLQVPWGTLTSWLKGEVEAGRMPKLDLIGGDVGQIVNLKEVKE